MALGFPENEMGRNAWVGHLLSQLQSCGELTEWEQDFVDDMTERSEKYGARIFISDKQFEILMRLRDERL